MRKTTRKGPKQRKGREKGEKGHTGRGKTETEIRKRQMEERRGEMNGREK